MKSVKSTKRSQLVGGLHSVGANSCPCCNVEMFMQGVERSEAFVSRYAKATGGRTPSAKEIRLATATMDHIVPQASGGTDRWENLLIMCRGCNDGKHSLSVPEWIAVRLHSGRPFKKSTGAFLLGLHIKAMRIKL